MKKLGRLSVKEMIPQSSARKPQILVYVITVLSIASNVSWGQVADTLDLTSIKTYVSEENSQALINHADEYLELALIEQPRRYSQAQAFYVIEKFFRLYPPKEFELRHTISQGDQWWVIGQYKVRDEQQILHMYLRFRRSSLEDLLISIQAVQIQ